MLQFERKNSVLKDGLTRIQFDIKNIYECTDSLSIGSINLTLISPPDLRQLLYDVKD